MKSKSLLKKQALTILLSLSSFAVFSQPQKHVLYFAEQQVDLTTGSASILNSSQFDLSNPPEYNHANGVHDQDGNQILKIVDGSVYNKFSQNIGFLENFGTSGHASTLDIIPFENNQCKYYIVYTDHNIPAACCVNGTEPCCDPGFTLYYSIVDLSELNGQGQIITNGQILDPFTDFWYTDVVVGNKNPSGDRYMYSINLERTFGFQDVLLKKFLVTSSGISLENQYQLQLPNNFDIIIGESELASDRSMIAFTDVSNAYINLIHLDPLNGDVDINQGNNGLTQYTMPFNSSYGIEFTDNNERLYVSGGFNEGIRFIDLNAGIISSVITGSEILGGSLIELGFDPNDQHKIYGITSGGASGNLLAEISDINDVTPVFSFSPPTNQKLIAGSDILSGVKRLPSQIDGEDYIERFNDPIIEPECCLFYEGIDIIQHDIMSSQILHLIYYTLKQG